MMTLAGQQYLALNGLATVHAEWDFETYSEAGYQWNEITQKWEGLRYASKGKYGLSVVGTYNYIQHPTFEIIQLAYNLKDGAGARIWRPGDREPLDLFDHIIAGRILEAWYTFFEVSVYTLHCVARLGWPALHEDRIRCCMAKAAIAGYPRGLNNAGHVLKLANLKDEIGGKLVKKLTVPRNPTKNNLAKRWTRENNPKDFARFDAYNIQDIIAEGEASLKIPDFSPIELKRWQVDQRINHRGMYIDRATVGNCLAIIDQAKQKYWAELRQITNGTVQTHSEVAKTLTWLHAQGAHLDSLDEDVISEELLRDHPPAIKRVLQIRATLSFGSVAKLNGIWNQTCSDGRLRDMFAFSAAHTHMWNGVGPQVMNLYKSDKFNKPEQIEFAIATLATRDLGYVERTFANGPPWDSNDNKPMEALDVIANCLRSIIIARPGARLMSADYNAIQAVITAALAGEKWQLDVFHAGGQIYLETASRLTGKPVAYYLQYRKDTGKHHPDRQLYGKIPTLANGFGAYIGGWRRFDDKKILGNDEEVKQLIFKTWAANPNICELWGGQVRNRFGRDRQGRRANEYEEYYGLEGAIVKAIRNPGTCYGYRGVRYQVSQDVLYCLPPGCDTPLIYHQPRLKPSTRNYARPWEKKITYVGWNTQVTKGAGGWVEMELYGGVATQNVVAKVHREIQADTLVRLDDTGVYLPVHHAHDENTCEVENGRGSLEEYLSLVNYQHSWAVDDWGRPWPIRAPGAEEVQRYGKYE